MRQAVQRRLADWLTRNTFVACWTAVWVFVIGVLEILRAVGVVR